MKCGKLSKYHKNIKSEVYPSEKHELYYFRFTENSPCPETQNKMVSSSKGMEVIIVCEFESICWKVCLAFGTAAYQVQDSLLQLMFKLGIPDLDVLITKWDVVKLIGMS